MVCLLDTGVLLRYVQPRDPLYGMTRNAVRTLRLRGDTLVCLAQNLAEFWCVATRPAAARGGLGMDVAQAEARVRLLQRSFTRLPEADAAFPIWLGLLTTHNVSGVQVHDARVVAGMLAHGASHILTFNPADFARYSVSAVHPQDV